MFALCIQLSFDYWACFPVVRGGAETQPFIHFMQDHSTGPIMEGYDSFCNFFFRFCP